MQSRSLRFLNLVRLCGFCALVLGLGFGPRQVFGQSALSKTTLGSSQNDARDLTNSLVPSPQRYGKGEKKGQVNTADLKSKPIKDTTFGGSLLNMGLDPAQPKLDEKKLHDSPSETAPKTSKETDATGVKDSQPSQSAGDKDPKISNSTTAVTDAQNKDQKTTASKSEEKPTDKAGKPDGDH